jgi:HK97 family phage major capsid protein
MCRRPFLAHDHKERTMTLNERIARGGLPFMAAFVLALVGMPRDIYCYNEREVGMAHAAPWLSKLSAAIDRAIAPLTRLIEFFRRPAVQRVALAATAVLVMSLLHPHAANAGVFLAGMTLTELRQKKGELVNQADEILKHAKEENRADLTAEEDAKFDAIHKDVDGLTKAIEREERQQKAAESLQSTGRRTEPNQTSHASGSRFTGKITEHDRIEAFRAWALAGTDAELTDAQRDIAHRCGLDLRAKTLNISLFSRHAMRSLDDADQRSWQRQAEETRAALTGAQSTTTTGGYTVADAAMRALEVALLEFGAMRQVASIIRTDTGGPLPMPTTNDTSNKGEIIGENTSYNETEMTFGQTVLGSFKYSSKYILASLEFLQDSSINVAEFIGQALGNRIGRIQNDHFTTGTGTTLPFGVVVGASSGVTSVADPPTYDNVVDLKHSVDPAYRTNARFMMNDTTLKSLLKVKVLQYSGDTTGYPLWSPGLAPGQPDTILGYPYVINQSMASPGSSAKKMLFGDFSKYMIRDVRDITLRRLDERFAELGQVAFLAFARADGVLLDAGTHPVKYMSQA